jgi:hypothetical protein
VNTLDDEAEDGRIIALQSLSNAQLIQILQHHDGDDDLTQMVEEELTRRRTGGAPRRLTRPERPIAGCSSHSGRRTFITRAARLVQ